MRNGPHDERTDSNSDETESDGVGVHGSILGSGERLDDVQQVALAHAE